VTAKASWALRYWWRPLASSACGRAQGRVRWTTGCTGTPSSRAACLARSATSVGRVREGTKVTQVGGCSDPQRSSSRANPSTTWWGRGWSSVSRLASSGPQPASVASPSARPGSARRASGMVQVAAGAPAGHYRRGGR
jgi:hypothetical protein